jgi:hypothetical protein
MAHEVEKLFVNEDTVNEEIGSKDIDPPKFLINGDLRHLAWLPPCCGLCLPLG